MSEEFPSQNPPLETTASLLRRARTGDSKAQNDLVMRYMDLLRRWARGRLPGYARDLVETADLVQDTLVKALARLDQFEPRREGAFLSYLRKILINEVRDQIRRARRHSTVHDSVDHLKGGTPSPLEHLITAETLDRYEAALDTLPDKTREAVILWLEFGYSHRQICEAIDGHSENATRMRVSRALAHLASEMSPRNE